MAVLYVTPVFWVGVFLTEELLCVMHDGDVEVVGHVGGTREVPTAVERGGVIVRPAHQRWLFRRIADSEEGLVPESPDRSLKTGI